jgi:hypothetical protein
VFQFHLVSNFLDSFESQFGTTFRVVLNDGRVDWKGFEAVAIPPGIDAGPPESTRNCLNRSYVAGFLRRTPEVRPEPASQERLAGLGNYLTFRSDRKVTTGQGYPKVVGVLEVSERKLCADLGGSYEPAILARVDQSRVNLDMVYRDSGFLVVNHEPNHFGGLRPAFAELSASAKGDVITVDEHSPTPVPLLSPTRTRTASACEFPSGSVYNTENGEREVSPHGTTPPRASPPAVLVLDTIIRERKERRAFLRAKVGGGVRKDSHENIKHFCLDIVGRGGVVARYPRAVVCRDEIGATFIELTG